MSSGGRRHNGSHNGHHGSGAGTAVEHNGHHPPREPRKEENTLVRRSFRRCGDEWRSDSRRCVFFFLQKIACETAFFSRFLIGLTNVTGTPSDATKTFIYLFATGSRVAEISDCKSLRISLGGSAFGQY